jgi:hypothetical protein
LPFDEKYASSAILSIEILRRLPQTAALLPIAIAGAREKDFPYGCQPKDHRFDQRTDRQRVQQRCCGITPFAAHFGAEALPELSAHFHNQAEEEKKHALRFIEHLIDVGAHVNIPTVPAPQAPFQCPSKIR